MRDEDVPLGTHLQGRFLRAETIERQYFYARTQSEPDMIYLRRRRCRWWSKVPLRLRRWLVPLLALSLLICALIAVPSVLLAIYEPRYSSPPLRYGWLEREISESISPGRANLKDEKIFIAASVNADTASLDGAWGRQMGKLINLLGSENVFLSLYVGGEKPPLRSSLGEWVKDLECDVFTFNDTHTYIETPSPTKLRNSLRGHEARQRNALLSPLDLLHASPHIRHDTPSTRVHFDRVLFVDTVYFDPISAVHLLFTTNSHNKPRRPYAAACAIDYGLGSDMSTGSLLRDANGQRPGVSLFPWFSKAGNALSRSAVLTGKEIVPVTSCWGGLVAVDGQWLQGSRALKFDSSGGTDARRLFLAALAREWRMDNPMAKDGGIYVNPYVRVARQCWLHHFLPVFIRFEHGASILQSVLTHIRGV